MVMKIDQETKYDLLGTIENLGMLKLFYDRGINVTKFPDSEVMSRHGIDEGSYIFESGISAIFGECSCLNSEEDRSLDFLKSLGAFKFQPSYVYEIPLSQEGFNLKLLPAAIKICNENEQHDHGKFIGDLNNHVLYIYLDYVGGLSLLAQRLILLQKILSQEIEIESTN